MKNILPFLVIIIVMLMITCSMSVVHFDDVNKYHKSIILKITPDSVGSIPVDKFYIKNVYGNYKELIVDPKFGQLFHEGDTL